MKPGIYALSLVFSGLTACTWVEPAKEGSEVTLVEASSVETCKKTGNNEFFCQTYAGIVTRSEEKVTEELITLAKNSAAEKGGDSNVAKGPASEGSMSFDIYTCGE